MKKRLLTTLLLPLMIGCSQSDPNPDNPSNTNDPTPDPNGAVTNVPLGKGQAGVVGTAGITE